MSSSPRHSSVSKSERPPRPRWLTMVRFLRDEDKDWSWRRLQMWSQTPAETTPFPKLTFVGTHVGDERQNALHCVTIWLISRSNQRITLEEVVLGQANVDFWDSLSACSWLCTFFSWNALLRRLGKNTWDSQLYSTQVRSVATYYNNIAQLLLVSR